MVVFTSRIPKRGDKMSTVKVLAFARSWAEDKFSFMSGTRDRAHDRSAKSVKTGGHAATATAHRAKVRKAVRAKR